LLPDEQKALRKGRRGCLDALVIDEAIASEAKLYRRNLNVAWIDYRKAYDMVPHRWLRKVLRAIRAPKMVSRMVSELIPLWRTDVENPHRPQKGPIPGRLTVPVAVLPVCGATIACPQEEEGI
jgi:hypothetical protein